MQPYYEAKSLSRFKPPAIVSQIGDGENGGVMMNEFPSAFKQAWHEITPDSDVVGVTGTEYLELIAAAGFSSDEYIPCQPVGQHLIWERVSPKNATPNAVENTITQLKQENPQFHMEGASWTNHISWVEGYENVLAPMNELSSLFHQKINTLSQKGGSEPFTRNSDYRQALLYNFLLQTSCFRYWGQGTWTEYAKAIYERGKNLM